MKALLRVLCAASEYDDLPVRHNEDRLNSALAEQVRWPTDTRSSDDPHTKACLLLQAHMGRLPLPITDYITDTKSVLDNSLRILQALVDISADAGWLDTALSAMVLVQSLMQGRWFDDNSLLMLHHLTFSSLPTLERASMGTLPQLLHAYHFRKPQAMAAL